MKKQSLEIVEEEKDIKGLCKEEENKRKWRWQMFIFIFTYISYSMLHFIREGWSILKPSVENEDSPGLNWMGSNNLGMVDFSFLICYSAGLFISGQLSDNFPIRIVLPTGFLLVCFATTMICIGGYLEITNVAYYMFFFAMSGFCQSIGWPSYIAVIGNWFPRYQRGLAFGIWCSCENIGNIGGNVLANFLVDVFEMDWMSAFLTVGIIVGIFGIINFVLLIEHPSRIGIVVETEEEIQEERIEKIFNKSIKPGYLRGKSICSNDEELNEHLNSPAIEEVFNQNKDHHQGSTAYEEEKAISFRAAWKIPGVLQYAICIAFVKCSTYGILYWLPSYSKYELEYSHSEIERIAIFYDVGVIVGNVIIGKLGDYLHGKRALVCSCSLFCGSLCFWYIVFFAHESIELTLIVIFFVGFFVHSIFNMIAATAATDLAKGCHHTRSDSDPNNHNVHPENHKAIATLSGILDGSGSFGAAIGSFVIGAIRRYSWTGMFVFLACAVFISSMVVLKPCIDDVKRLLYERQTKKNNNILKSLE